MKLSIYIWQENQEQLEAVAKKQELINKLLKVYFQKKAKEDV